MRDEKRRRTRDDEFSSSKRKRDDSPVAHCPAASLSVSKSRNHMPVSERQQFALLKLMETKNSPSDRGTTLPCAKQSWESRERDLELERPSPPGAKSQYSATPTVTSSGSTPSRYSSPHQDSGHQTEKSSGSYGHPHCFHAYGHASSCHHSTSRKPAPQQHRGNGAESALMRASKKGDLLTVKMLIKEGVDVNEQDVHGRTALHEGSVQNFSHLVGYLLKHNANPNLRAIPRGGNSTMGNGNTPLHEAAREGHVRIIRALLRYGADPKICNANGDRPVDLCPNEASQAILRQSSQLRDHASTSSSMALHSTKKSSTTSSRSPPLDAPHLSRGSLIEEHVGGCVKRRSSPEHSNSSPGYGQSQQHRASISPHSHTHHHHHSHKHHSPNAVRRNTMPSSTPSVLVGETASNILQPPRPVTKKDPYAFDDEEVELTPQLNQEIPSQAPTNNTASGSSSPPHTHRFSSTFLPPATTSSLHVNTVGADPSHSGPPSSVSPNTCGPPLKLRFAIEAGHYTVMENQDNQMDQAAVAGLAAATIDVTLKQEDELLVSKNEQSGQGTSYLAVETNVERIKAESGEHKPNACLGETDDRESDDGRSPKVPPLRIKLGNTSPPSPPSSSHQSTLSLPLELSQAGLDNALSTRSPNDTADGAEKAHDNGSDPHATTSQLSCIVDSTEVVDGKEHETCGEASKGEQEESCAMEDTDEGDRKWGDALFAASHQTRRGGGKLSKVTSSTSLSAVKSTNESLTRKHVPDSNEARVKDNSEVKPDETPKTRSSRTLRSHTAAQREREEREKRADVTPLKKRKYRTKGPSGNGAGGTCSGAESNSNNDHRTDETDAGKFTDHEDTTTNEISLRPNSTASTITGDNNAGDEEQIMSDSGGANVSLSMSGPAAQDNGSKPTRVFDDPSKLSVAGWGENPYEKASELNRGLTELIGKLVELQPKEPTGYQDYLLVTRGYLLADRIPQHQGRRPCPSGLPAPLAELYEEQEEERYAQTLKHQSEREQLRLCAEQSVLRAQTRATIALANQPRPLSFCSVMAFKGFTYLPPFKDPEHRDEENVRDRFKARTLIGWLQDIKDNFHLEKKKLLCRQLHEAESLMMVQKLDWEVKLKELHVYDYRANVFDKIPSQHVPLIEVPSDFPLFVHDPIQRPP
uniref:ANK_REP_REGION domain-containing protein n=1 Tax=Mesocestoides corti TaxID=53468 RepID=A0A5K3FSH9_MESCO